MGAKGKNVVLAIGALTALGVTLYFGTRAKAEDEGGNGGNGGDGYPGNLHGSITDVDTGEPIINAHVAIGCYYENMPGYYWCHDDFFDGEYCFELEPGEYVVWCGAPGGYEPIYFYNVVVGVDTALNIELAPG